MRGFRVVAVVAVLLAMAASAEAQTSAADLFGKQKAPEGQPKTYLEELMLFGYVENSAVWNLGNVTRGNLNDLRFYDLDAGYTFNMAEFGIKRDPDEAFPFGMGLVLTAGQDSKKNHSIGILRSDTDTFPFRNTPWFDIQEAYISGRAPIGNGPTLKLGKFVTLLGYEVIEGPSTSS